MVTIADQRAELDEHLLTIDDFAAIWATHERVSARLALAVAEFDTNNQYATNGAVTMAAWLRQHCRMSDRDATALVARGRFLSGYQPVAKQP